MSVGQSISWACTTEKGQNVSSDSLKGSKYILCFYPKALTPGCTQEMCSISADYAKFEEEGYQIFGISGDDATRQLEFQKKHTLTLPLLCDTTFSVSKAFDTYGEKKAFGRVTVGVSRTSFIIDENNIITHVVNKINVKAHAQQLLLLINPQKYEEKASTTEEINLSGRPRRQSSRQQEFVDSITEDETETEESDYDEEKDAEDDSGAKKGAKKASTAATTKRKSAKAADTEDEAANAALGKKKRGRPSTKAPDSADQVEVQLGTDEAVSTMNDQEEAASVVVEVVPVIQVAPVAVVVEAPVVAAVPVFVAPVVEAVPVPPSIEHAQPVEDGFLMVDNAHTVPADHIIVEAPVVEEAAPAPVEQVAIIVQEAPTIVEQ